MTRKELREIIRGPFMVPPTPFDADYRLDLDTMVELTKWWLDSGYTRDRTVIKVAATLGENHDLSDDEWPRLLTSVVDAAGDRGAVVCGFRSRGTLEMVEAAKKAEALGAIGIQVEFPIFHCPNQDDLLRYYTAVSEAITIGIVIYDSWWWGIDPLAISTIERLAETENIVAMKWSVPPNGDYDEMRKIAQVINVIDNQLQPVRCHRNGGHGFISQTVAACPEHDLKIWNLLEAGRYDEAQQAYDAVQVQLNEFSEKSNRTCGGYWRVTKGLMSAVGRPVGPPRPPTIPLTEHEQKELNTLVEAWGWV